MHNGKIHNKYKIVKNKSFGTMAIGITKHFFSLFHFRNILAMDATNKDEIA